MGGAASTTTDSAVRRRRVRLFEILFVFFLVFSLLFSAFYWSDFSVSPGVSASYVKYESTDGAVISGALFRPSSPAGLLPGVVVVHGLTDYKEELNRLSVELARRGFVVLAIDLRDHGMSTGECTFGLPGAEPEDVAGAVAYLRAAQGVDADRMAVVGHSFGGMVALTAASKASTQVNATVTWGAPVNLTSLARDSFATVSYVSDKRVLPADLLDPDELRVRSPIEYMGNLRDNSTLLLHSLDDELIPVSQAFEGFNLTQARGARLETVSGVGHSMDSLEVLEMTIEFIELKTKGRVSGALDPVYTAFQRDEQALRLSLTLLGVPLAWLSWEFWCTRNPQTVRIYNYPADKRRWVAVAFGAADLAAFLLVVRAAGTFVAPGASPLLFAGALPAPTLFSAALVAGVLLCAAAFTVSRVERAVRGRDDKHWEEGESLARSTATAVPVILMVPATAALQFLLFLGSDFPRSQRFLLVFALFLVLMLGFEAFLRLRVQKRLRGTVAAVFGATGLSNAIGSIVVGSVLYFLMLWWALLWLFQGYATLPSDALQLTVAVGVVSSLLFDRTKNIVPGALISSAFITWILNAPFHF